jgi:hypothetical protein
VVAALGTELGTGKAQRMRTAQRAKMALLREESLQAAMALPAERAQQQAETVLEVKVKLPL